MELSQGPGLFKALWVGLPQGKDHLGWPDDRSKLFSGQAQAVEKILEPVVEALELVDPGKVALPLLGPRIQQPVAPT